MNEHPLDPLLFFANMLRGTVIALSLFCVALSGAICFTFYRRTRFERVNYLPNRGEILEHVILVTAFSVIMSGYIAAEMIGHFGRAMTWRSPTLFVAFSVLAVAHWKMYGRQTRILTRDKTRVEMARNMVVVDDVQIMEKPEGDKEQ